MSRSKLTSFRRRSGWHLIRALNVCLGLLPFRAVCLLGDLIGRMSYHLAHKKRSLALNSLKQAFPQKSSEQNAAVARRCFRNMAINYCEMIHFLKYPQRLVEVEIEGRQHLEQALSRQTGVVGLTAHLGLFTLMHYKLAQEGFPVSVVTRPMRNKDANDFFAAIRDRIGIESIYSLPARAAVQHVLQSLRKNRLVIIQMDQFAKKGGVTVDFFGYPANTPSGPVVFAQRTGAVILPMMIIRTRDGKHVIKIEPPYEMPPAQNKREDTQRHVQLLTKRIEKWICTYPDQWGWIHNRWNTSGPP
jgi:KDO2-lipid IV(A) lauroyltransferase